MFILMMHPPEGSVWWGAPEEIDGDRDPALPCPSRSPVDAAALTIGRQIVGLPVAPDGRLDERAISRDAGGTHEPFGPKAPEIRPVAHLLIDVDQLAAIAARHGQVVAERVVGETAARLRSRLRRGDRLERDPRGRLFAVCSCPSIDGARAVAERLRAVAAAGAISIDRGTLTVTITIDVTLEAGRERRRASGAL